MTLIISSSLPTYEQLEPNIYVERVPDRPDFTSKIEHDLAILRASGVGKRLLDLLNAGKHSVFIRYKEGANECTPCDIKGMRTPEIGSSSIISLSLVEWVSTSIREEDTTIPSFVTLAHELIHALHFSDGSGKLHTSTVDPVVWTSDEEYSTIVGFKGDEVTENALREEFRLSRRVSHLNGSVLRDPSIIGRITKVSLEREAAMLIRKMMMGKSG